VDSEVKIKQLYIDRFARICAAGPAQTESGMLAEKRRENDAFCAKHVISPTKSFL